MDQLEQTKERSRTKIVAKQFKHRESLLTYVVVRYFICFFNLFLLLKKTVFISISTLISILIQNNEHIRSMHNIIVSIGVVFALTTIGDYINKPVK